MTKLLSLATLLTAGLACATSATAAIMIEPETGYVDKVLLDFESLPLGGFTGNEFAAQGVSLITGTGANSGSDVQNNILTGNSLFVDRPGGNLVVINSSNDSTGIAAAPSYSVQFSEARTRFGASFSDQTEGNFTYDFRRNGVSLGTKTFNVGSTSTAQYAAETSFQFDEVVITSAIADGWGIDNISFEAEALQSQTIYRENFANTTGGFQGTSYVDWQVHRGAGGSAAPTNNNSSTSNPLSANAAGDPNLVDPVNSGSTGTTNLGYFFNGTDTNNIPYLNWTDEFTVDRLRNRVEQFAFSLNNSNTNDLMRVAIEIDGQWYASEETFSGNNYVDHALEFTTDGSAWRMLDFMPGSVLSLSGSTLAGRLPDGNITAFGLFSDNKTNAQRFDNFSILATAVPEPSSALLTLVGLAGLATLRRRR